MTFSTRISRIGPGSVAFRGYPVEQIVAAASAGETIFLVIRGRRPSQVERCVFDAVLACCAEHGFANTAAVAARYVMSGSGNLPGALAAGILAFGQHTGTANLTAEMLSDVASSDPRMVSNETIEAHIGDLRSRGRAVPGLGHPIHKVSDPREEALRKVMELHGFYSPHSALLDRVHEMTCKMLGRRIVLNVDGLIGALLMDMGFTPPEIFAVNILGAMPGIAAHAVEEQAQGRKLRFPSENEISYDHGSELREWLPEVTK